ncbi:hypothetical protein [Streptomyces sp. MJM1172]|uniref:hypothetical protein n=1 Tax=Streptomyces sp. MJM1172 TaxID=1703926 RepID=UPI000B12EAAE|nr:hypothetical protein [Streptomyces sp. MJM1172]
MAGASRSGGSGPRGLLFDRLVSGGDVPREALEGLVSAARRKTPGSTGPHRGAAP